MSKKLRSYPKVYDLGHPAIAALFEGPVVVQEKVDGSQFSFGVVDGVLHARSKGATLHLDDPNKLFRGALDTALRLFDGGLLEEGWTYRGEALMRPKHNTLEYGRAPEGNVILFDVDTGLEDRVADPEHLAAIAERLGLEVVPTLHVGTVENVDAMTALLDRESCLGGCKVEGVVFKNYERFGKDGKMLMGKHVSEAFKEKHTKDWKKRNPTRADVVEALKQTYRSEARWAKAVQHLAEAGTLDHEPRDIGKLMKEVPEDVRAECEDEIKDALFKHFWPQIKRGVTAGLPEWYKARLAERQFAESEAA